MRCLVCAKEIQDGSTFCLYCGMPTDEKELEKLVQSEDGNLKEMQSYFQDESAGYENSGFSQGFSNRVNDPEILAAVKKNNRAGFGCAVLCVFIPFFAIVIGSMITEELEIMTAVMIGAGVSVLFFIFYLLFAIHKRFDKSWDGVVTKQYTRERQERYRDDDRDWYETYTECITVFKTDRGRKKKIRERSGRSKYYDYLRVGDRVRYHPQFVFQYEKYDKSHDKYLYCPVCATMNKSSDDRCKKCHVPLLK